MAPREVEVFEPKPGSNDSATLEKRYIKLLEERIRQLEVDLDKASKTNEDDNESKSEDEEDKNDNLTSPDGKEGEPSSLIRVVISKFDHETSQRRDYDSSKVPQTSNKAKAQHPVTFRRYMMSDLSQRLDYEQLLVSFDGMKDLLRKYVKHCSPKQFDAESIGFVTPFRNFLWQWEELTQACKPVDTDTEKEALARRYLDEAMGLIKSSESLDSYFKSYESNRASGTVTYEYLWTIFPPGAKVLAKSFLDDYQVFEVQHCDKANVSPGSSAVVLVIAGFDWDGEDFVRVAYHLYIPEFQGSTPIRNLPCFPLSYYQSDGDPTWEKVKCDILVRGQRFIELCTSRTIHHRYEGSVLYHTRRQEVDQDSDSESPRRGPLTRTGRLRRSEIIVDNSSFMRSSRCPANGSLPLGSFVISNAGFFECPCLTCRDSLTQKWSRNLHLFESKEKQYQSFKSSDDHLLLCPPKVLGYSLKLGRWAQFSIGSVQPIVALKADDLDESFDTKLRLDSSYKKLIRALVETHKSNTDLSQRSDIVEGKGKGLVILLHGPPGVGKTLTAETVALATHKPLMPVSTAEIGLEPNEAERNLTDIFEDAGRWQAVLLMDEADIFLEERRGTRDLQRNALVGVLLRVLEYYEGIIILTTNRITSLDVAVQSRIHLAIRYRDLGHRDRVELFRNFLDDIVKEENVEWNDDMDEKIERMVKRSKINGRQIRNIITSANLLAKSQNKKLRFKHIEDVHEITEQFLDGLKDLTQKKRTVNEGTYNDSD